MAAVTASAILPGRYTGLSRAPSAEAILEEIPRVKVGALTLPATTDDGDTATVDLYKQFGITKVLAIEGFIHTTTDSVIVAEAPTTTVDRETLTITVGGSTDNKKRFYVIWGV